MARPAGYKIIQTASWGHRGHLSEDMSLSHAYQTAENYLDFVYCIIIILEICPLLQKDGFL